MIQLSPFTPAVIPSNATVPAAVVNSLASGETAIAIIHTDILTPASYASSLARAKYLRQRGIRAAYRNNYTAPRRGGNPYCYGDVIVVARGVRIPKGFTAAFA